MNGKKDTNDDSSGVTLVTNYINGKFVPPSTNEYMDVLNPSNSQVIGRVGLSSSTDVDEAVDIAHQAQKMWANNTTIKQRAGLMMKLHALIQQHAHELASLIVLENGKNMTEALADVAKGNETVEYACSLPQLAQGKNLQVSSQVHCQDLRQPLGVVASIVPFNFPCMVPFWTTPIALVLGNAVILKPSEKVPLTMRRIADLFQQAGFPDGVFNMIQGTKDAVNAIIDHPKVSAVTFVGSSPVAKLVANRCRALDKRCTALGGAKNHLVALPDCELDGASSDITVSAFGCSGQRCMAASVLLLVGDQERLLQEIVNKASKIQPGSEPTQMGPVIDTASYTKILSYIEDAEKQGATILLDGRNWKNKMENGNVGGNWIGPTVILHQSPEDKAMKEEVFGPVLSVYKVESWEDAIDIENNNPFGNAASVYTTNGGNADWFTSRFRASMLGVNIGIPVPREPFSFGGLYGTKSKFGDMDITGDGAMEFFTNRIKITSKWPLVKPPASRKRPHDATFSIDGQQQTDSANFAGQM
ncbi:methylmalonate-semialdehyde dehydrogenase [Nitzschia inconspicua]|uniref:methylmalonate-semialdehyde dehydrogenase (CoA acylating) n=1 Tax=Nitzschia inconspicua TaxID=303405 RepID=A0A9K3LSU1_9STRA|nr:methylmalonate-semialdehyde dehydrogenase [Nitzschia inconspicua]